MAMSTSTSAWNPCVRCRADAPMATTVSSSTGLSSSAVLSSSCSLVPQASRLASPALLSEDRHRHGLSPVTAVASPPRDSRAPGRADTRQGPIGGSPSGPGQGPLSTRKIGTRPSVRAPPRQLTRPNQGLNKTLERIQQKRASGAILQRGLEAAMASEAPPRPDMQPMERLELERGVCKPFKKYSPERIRAIALASPQSLLGVGLRGTHIVTALSFYWLSLWTDKITGVAEEMVPKRAAQLRNLLCELGPSFIKAGQVLANRPDIIREDYMNELCILQDDVPAFPTKEAFDMIEEQLGRPLQEVFSKISPEPVAAASLGQVYRAQLRDTGAEVAIKVQRPGVEPVIYRDLFLFRALASFLNGISIQKLGCNAELIVDEFGEKLLDELDYLEEARNIQSFYENFLGDETVKIPYCYRELSGPKCLVMEWIDGIRCTDPQAIRDAGIDIKLFLTTGVSAALRQLLEFGLFHGDPHPGNIFAMRDGRIAYVDFGNVAELSQYNKEILIDAVVHAVNEDYLEMAGDFTRLGFLAPGTEVAPLVPALEAIWQNSTGQSLADFNFRSVTGKFNELVYNYPIRIPERFSLVIRSLLTQEGICLTLEPNFKFLEVAYPYVAKRLLTDPDPALRSRLIQVLFKDGMFQWKRLENLILLAKEQVAISKRRAVLAKAASRSAGPLLLRGGSSNGGALVAAGAAATALPAAAARVPTGTEGAGGLDLRDTLQDGARLLLFDEGLRQQLLMAFTQDSRLHVREVLDIYNLVSDELPPEDLVTDIVGGLPKLGRDILLTWSDKILSQQ